jgi:hypothetical protein
MKKLLFIFFAFASLSGYSQIVRTLSNVNNTADSLKPVSNPQQTALNLKQNILSGTGFVKSTGGTISYDASTYLTAITSGLVTGALGYTPYNGTTNPNGYLTSVPAQTFASITSKPTTISGYGITDFNSLGDARYSVLAHSHLFSAITSKPTTLSGYGITDAYPLTGNPSAFLTSISSANITTALGFTPYNATNPSNYIALTGLSSTATGLTYTNTTGAFSLTSGYTIPTTSQLSSYLTSSTASTTYSPIASPVHTGDIETTTLNAGVIVKSPNGTRFRLTVSNTGDIIATSL